MQIQRRSGFWIALALLVLSALSVAPASAQVTFSLDQTLFEVVRPSSGQVFVPVSGTIDITNPTFDLANFSISSPFQSPGVGLAVFLAPTFSTYHVGFNPGVDFVGDIFSVRVRSIDQTGDYFFDTTLANPANASMVFQNANGVVGRVATFGVRVIEANVAAPEPGTITLLTVSLLLIGTVHRTHLSKRTR